MPALVSKLLAPPSRLPVIWQMFKRHGHARTITRLPNSTTWMRVKDLTHFYLAVGAIVFGGTALVVDTLYGPCQLQDTPEDYEPRFWQYEKHPMYQLIIRYSSQNPQKNFEQQLGFIDNYTKKEMWEREELRARRLMYERQDYKAWYYIPYTTKWVEWSRTEYEVYKKKWPAFMQHQT